MRFALSFFQKLTSFLSRKGKITSNKPMKAKFISIMLAAVILLPFATTSCEEEENPENADSLKTQTSNPLVDENGNTAKIDVTVIKYEDTEYPVTDEDGYFVYDENGEIVYDKYEVKKVFSGKTVYMFDDEDVTDKSKALKKVITDIRGTAVFELSEDFFKEDNPAFYFAVYDNDNVIAHGALNIKRGKESAIMIDTKGFTSGALYYYNLVKTYELHSLSEDYKMNVKARGNLMNENFSKVQIQLPENTVSWYFSFNCVEKKENNAALGLFKALLKFFDPTKGLASDAIDQIMQPKGSVDCNVWLEDEYGNRLATKITHLTDGKMEEKQYINGTYYLVFENPFFARGISINLDIVAMTVNK